MTELYLQKTEKLNNKKTVPSNERVLSDIGTSLICNAISEKFNISVDKITVARTPLGAPYIPGLKVFVSISHTNGVVAGCISDLPVGVDIDLIRKINHSVMRRYYSEDERQKVESADDMDFDFSELWTAKEAYGKLKGIGIREPLELFDVHRKCSENGLIKKTVMVSDDVICTVISHDTEMKVTII